MQDLSGSAAIVTGGASGIGAALVELLTSRGARVIAGDVNELGLAALADRTGCLTRIVDVTSEADSAALVGAAGREFGQLDLAFLNAGVLGRTVVEQSDGIADVRALRDRYSQVMAVNVDGVVYGTLAAAEAMDGSGAIVATASVAGLIPWTPDPTYTASKHAVVGWVRAIAPALEPLGVTIDAICPGGVATPLVGASADMAEANPRMLAPATVADAILATALESETGRAVSVVAGREPERVAHEFSGVAGFDMG